jgi:DNA-binding transcriptional regulator YiaG
MGEKKAIEFDNIADGVIIDRIDKKKANEGRNKRLFAEAFIKVRNEAGMNRKDFAEWLGIPYRTMQDWERGISQVPEYVLRLVAYKVMWEKERGNLS